MKELKARAKADAASSEIFRQRFQGMENQGEIPNLNNVKI